MDLEVSLWISRLIPTGCSVKLLVVAPNSFLILSLKACHLLVCSSNPSVFHGIPGWNGVGRTHLKEMGGEPHVRTWDAVGLVSL